MSCKIYQCDFSKSGNYFFDSVPTSFIYYILQLELMACFIFLSNNAFNLQKRNLLEWDIPKGMMSHKNWSAHLVSVCVCV